MHSVWEEDAPQIEWFVFTHTCISALKNSHLCLSHTFPVRYLKIQFPPFSILSPDLKWIWNETLIGLLFSLTQSIPLLLAIFIPHSIDLLVSECRILFAFLALKWPEQVGQLVSVFPVQQNSPSIIFSGRTEQWMICTGSCEKQEQTRSPAFPMKLQVSHKVEDNLHVVATGACMTYRPLGNSVFIFINFNYRSTIKFSHSVLREKCRS